MVIFNEGVKDSMVKLSSLSEDRKSIFELLRPVSEQLGWRPVFWHFLDLASGLMSSHH